MVDIIKDDTEKKILEAANAVFLRKGMDGARMQEIADEAGINKALLHYYFRSKDRLFDAVFKKVFMVFFPQIPEKMNEDIPFEDKIEWIVSNYIDFLDQNPFIPQFIITEINRKPERVQQLFNDGGLNPLTILSLIGNLKILPFDPRHFILNFIGMIIFPYIGRPLFEGLLFNDNKEAYTQFLAERKQIIVRTLLNSISAENKS